MRREHDPGFALSETLHASPFAQSLVELILACHVPRLEAFFGQPLELNTELHFLTYEQGGFIRPHRDVMHGDGVLEKISERVVLFTLFLNGEMVRRATPSRAGSSSCTPHPTSVSS